jgi:hypothetical protein
VVAVGQGTFQNLDFEQSTILSSHPSGYGFDTGIATVPGWTAYNDGVSSNYSGGMTLIYNDRPIDSPGICLEGADYPGERAIQGNYSVFLMSGSYLYPGWPEGVQIRQSGRIPPTARSLTYWGDSYGALRITFSGQVLLFSVMSSAPSYTVYGADVSAYAGQTGELLFNAYWPYGGGMLDNIQFSNQRVPEPSVCSLSALGALLLGWSSLRRRRCQRN